MVREVGSAGPQDSGLLSPYPNPTMIWIELMPRWTINERRRLSNTIAGYGIFHNRKAKDRLTQSTIVEHTRRRVWVRRKPTSPVLLYGLLEIYQPARPPDS